ncbi:MAG: 30S ribosomal protein S4 [Candidatus Doudnabacteria bacterium]|nr:30S ribosomal protein S4 [Candidatus Doudnabacteria bacterium]
MATYIGPKSRKSRRVGAKLFPKDDRIFTKRNFPPGMHLQRRRRLSGFAQQLLEKQKAKWMYGIFEKQFRRYYREAMKKSGETGVVLMQLLETRLDNVVYRLGLAQTRPQARQLVSHGFFNVNGKKVNIPSFALKPGDLVSVIPKKLESKFFQTQKSILANYQPPVWLELNIKDFGGKVIAVPQAGDLEQLVNPQLIIEHYSR